MDTEVQRAERLAREIHANQVEESTGEPYINHVTRVVDLVRAEANDWITLAAAWLHDVIEDSDVTEGDLFVKGFSTSVIDVVVIVSRLPNESYEDYIEEILNSENPRAILVKKADLRDHLRPNCPESLRPRYEAAWKRITGEDFHAS